LKIDGNNLNKKGRAVSGSASFYRHLVTHHFLGDWVAAGLMSLFTSLPSGFFTSGVVPALPGLPVGEGLGFGDGVGDVCTGVETGFTGSCTFGSQAAKTAALAANITVKIVDLLIAYSSLF
jgi:hypothetical protein